MRVFILIVAVLFMAGCGTSTSTDKSKSLESLPPAISAEDAPPSPPVVQ